MPPSPTSPPSPSPPAPSAPLSRSLATTLRVAPCLWFDDQAEEAARFYISVFPNSGIDRVTRYGREGHDFHGRPPGSIMTIDFRLDGQPFTALNGGPLFDFNEAVSLQVMCEDQAEVDHYWGHLSEGGDPRDQQCGWLKDRYGVSWQIIPRELADLIGSPGSERSRRAMRALLRMEKISLPDIRRAWNGDPKESVS